MNGNTSLDDNSRQIYKQLDEIHDPYIEKKL